MNAPRVSVVMPVYNAQAFLEASVRSILEQSFTGFELIIIDDGSTDGSADIIRSFTDARIRYSRQANQGISRALNTGIAAARAPLIARQDADDVSLPQRLEKQVLFMEQHPEVGLLGTWATTISSDGRPTGALEHRTEHDAIRWLLLFDSPFVHPSVMFRKDLFERTGGYDPDPGIFEDLDLWYRMVPLTRTANLPERLLLYRDVPTGLSNSTDKRKQRLMECRRRHFARVLPALPANELDAMLRMRFDHPRITTRDLRAVHARLDAYIAREVASPELQRDLRADLHHRLMDFRVVAHRSPLHRAMDKAWKTIVLGLGPGAPSA